MELEQFKKAVTKCSFIIQVLCTVCHYGASSSLLTQHTKNFIHNLCLSASQLWSSGTPFWILMIYFIGFWPEILVCLESPVCYWKTTVIINTDWYEESDRSWWAIYLHGHMKILLSESEHVIFDDRVVFGNVLIYMEIWRLRFLRRWLYWLKQPVVISKELTCMEIRKLRFLIRWPHCLNNRWSLVRSWLAWKYRKI